MIKKNTVSWFAIAVLFVAVNQSSLAQDGYVANKVFYTELGGPGLIMSANVDGRFKSKERLGLGFRIGAGFGVGKFHNDQNPEKDVRRTYYSVPAGLNYVFGKPSVSSTFEVGAGVAYLTREVSIYNIDVEKLSNWIGFVSFMYRVTPVNGGFSFRIGMTPIIGTAGDLFPMGALSLGYAF